jgi:hypothetical protein
MLHEAPGIIRIQTAEHPSGCIEPTIIHATVIARRRIVMGQRVLPAGVCLHKNP